LNSDEILETLSELFWQSAGLNKEWNTSKTTDEKIVELFKQLGLPNNLKGYEYCVTAIKVYKQKGNVPFTKEIYPEVAKIHGTTPSKVDRTIRNAITVMADRCPLEVLTKVFGNTISPHRGIPTNTEYISVLDTKV